MGNCNDKIEYTCGKKVNARCVDYEGKHSECTNLTECSSRSVHTTLEDIADQLTDLCNKVDTSGLSDSCLTYDESDGEQVRIVDILNKLQEEVCALKDIVEAEEACPSIFTQDISCLGLDYNCLADPCGVQPQNLAELLQLIINQACPPIA